MRTSVRMIRLLGTELLLLWRHGIIVVAGIVYGIYAWMLSQLPLEWQGLVGALMVFSDPAMLGFLFIGTLIMLDRQTGRLDAIRVSPAGLSGYLLRKTLLLIGLALAGALLIVLKMPAYPSNPGLFLLGFVYAAGLFLALGIWGASRVSSLNAYLMLIPLGFLPLLPPILFYFGVNHWSFFLLPTHAMLLLLHPDVASFSFLTLLYACMYPLPWLLGTWRIALIKFASI